MMKMAIPIIKKMEVTSKSLVKNDGRSSRVCISEELATILGTRYSEIPLQIYKKGSNLALSLLTLPYEKVCDVDLHWYNTTRSPRSPARFDEDPQYFQVPIGVFDEGEYKMTLIQQTDKIERHILCEKEQRPLKFYSWSEYYK